MNTCKVNSLDGTTIVFDRYGTGPAVILVDGALQHRAIDPETAEMASILARQYTVFHYDRRGRGDSGDTLPYAVDREIEDLDTLIHAAGGSAFVFGMSSGAVLALEAAARGLAITKLALYEPPFNTEEDQLQESQYYTQQLNAFLADGRRSDAVAFAMTMFGAPVETVAEMQHSPMWSRFESAAPTLAYDNAIMGDGFVPIERMASVTVATLVIDGGSSFDFMKDAARVLIDALPNAQRRTLEGQTHNVDPKVLAQTLMAFFAGDKS
jgi:pimeloyl-ACP methyl ester carboxylesterase